MCPTRCGANAAWPAIGAGTYRPRGGSSWGRCNTPCVPCTSTQCDFQTYRTGTCPGGLYGSDGYTCEPQLTCNLNKNEYQQTPPLPLTGPPFTSDRVCAVMQTVCGPGQVEIPPTMKYAPVFMFTSDRVCKNLTTCDPATQFEASPALLMPGRQPPVYSKDAVCTDFRVCTADEYEQAPPVGTVQRVCLPLTVCCDNATECPQRDWSLSATPAQGTTLEYEATPPTKSSNRRCPPVRAECDDDQYEEATPTSQRSTLKTPSPACSFGPSLRSKDWPFLAARSSG